MKYSTVRTFTFFFQNDKQSMLARISRKRRTDCIWNIQKLLKIKNRWLKTRFHSWCYTYSDFWVYCRIFKALLREEIYILCHFWEQFNWSFKSSNFTGNFILWSIPLLRQRMEPSSELPGRPCMHELIKQRKVIFLFFIFQICVYKPFIGLCVVVTGPYWAPS